MPNTPYFRAKKKSLPRAHCAARFWAICTSNMHAVWTFAFRSRLTKHFTNLHKTNWCNAFSTAHLERQTYWHSNTSKLLHQHLSYELWQALEVRNITQLTPQSCSKKRVGNGKHKYKALYVLYKPHKMMTKIHISHSLWWNKCGKSEVLNWGVPTPWSSIFRLQGLCKLTSNFTTDTLGFQKNLLKSIDKCR